MIRFLFDMGLPRRAAEDLQAEGIDAVHLGRLGMARLPDEQVIELAVREGRTIVTLDRDFTQIIAVSGARVPSVVYVRQNEPPLLLSAPAGRKHIHRPRNRRTTRWGSIVSDRTTGRVRHL